MKPEYRTNLNHNPYIHRVINSGLRKNNSKYLDKSCAR